MLKIKNIKWDTDGDKEVFASLPQEIDFDENKLHLNTSSPSLSLWSCDMRHDCGVIFLK